MLIENEDQGTWREAYLAWKGAILSESQVQLLTEDPSPSPNPGHSKQ